MNNRADLWTKWQYTEGRRARAVWIDAPPKPARKRLAYRPIDLLKIRLRLSA